VKKHSLVEHWNDVSTWWHDVHEQSMIYPTDQQEQMIFFTAYERWLNDRELLTVEDSYQWNTPRENWIGTPPGTIR
jgi:hypothetical protein